MIFDVDFPGQGEGFKAIIKLDSGVYTEVGGGCFLSGWMLADESEVLQAKSRGDVAERWSGLLFRDLGRVGD